MAETHDKQVASLEAQLQKVTEDRDRLRAHAKHVKQIADDFIEAYKVRVCPGCKAECERVDEDGLCMSCGEDIMGPYDDWMLHKLSQHMDILEAHKKLFPTTLSE